MTRRSVLAMLSGLAVIAATATQAAEPVKITYISTVSRVTNIPTLVGLKLAEQDGIQVAIKDVRASEAAVGAVADGQGEIGAGFAPIFPAIEKGAHIVAVFEMSKPEAVLVAKDSIKTPADLNGVKLGTHSPKGTQTVLLMDWLAKQSGVKPNIIYVPEGSPARAQALLQGGLDAATMDLTSADTVERRAPGKFRVLFDFTNYPVSNSFLIVNTDYMKKHPDVVQKVVQRQLESYRRGIEDPKFWAREGQPFFKDMKPDVLEAQLRQSVKIYDRDGGIARMKGEGAMDNIKFYVTSGLLTPPASKWKPERFFDAEFLDAAMKAGK